MNGYLVFLRYKIGHGQIVVMVLSGENITIRLVKAEKLKFDFIIRLDQGGVRIFGKNLMQSVIF